MEDPNKYIGSVFVRDEQMALGVKANEYFIPVKNFVDVIPTCWSEEDMSKVQRICKYLNEAKKYYADITEVRECIDWLESLKERIKEKQL